MEDLFRDAPKPKPESLDSLSNEGALIFEVPSFRETRKHLVGVNFFCLNRVEYSRVIIQTQQSGPSAQGSVDCDLVMLNLLNGADQSHVA